MPENHRGRLRNNVRHLSPFGRNKPSSEPLMNEDQDPHLEDELPVRPRNRGIYLLPNAFTTAGWRRGAV